MLGWLDEVNPIVVDVVVVAILVLITFFGVLKSMKKSLLTFLVIAVSLFLGFSPCTNLLKVELVEHIFKISEWIPAGSTNVFVFSTTLFAGFLSSLSIFVLLALVLTVLKVIIARIIKRKSRREAKSKTVLGRIFGGLFSFVYQGALVLLVLLLMNSNIVGMKSVINESKVTKFLVTNTEKLINTKDENLTTKIIVKVLNGNVLFNVEHDVVKAYEYADDKIIEVTRDTKYIERVEDATLSEEKAKQLMKDRLLDLSNMAVIASSFDDINSQAKNLFPKVAEEWLSVIHGKWKERNFSQIEFTVNDKGTISLNLKNAGVTETVINWFDEITVGK